MKVMILVKGASARGKSQSIKRLARKMPFTSFIEPWHNDDYDSYVIGTVKGEDGREHIVGIENQGDPFSNQKAWIEKCVAAGSEVIVAACRSYGQTYRDATQIAYDNGYELIETTTLFHNGNSILPNGIDLSEVFAENMLNTILKCLV